jgi:hypothetical protein
MEGDVFQVLKHAISQPKLTPDEQAALVVRNLRNRHIVSN